MNRGWSRQTSEESPLGASVSQDARNLITPMDLWRMRQPKIMGDLGEGEDLTHMVANITQGERAASGHDFLFQHKQPADAGRRDLTDGGEVQYDFMGRFDFDTIDQFPVRFAEPAAVRSVTIEKLHDGALPQISPIQSLGHLSISQNIPVKEGDSLHVHNES
jgi:hypothetical protein